MPFASTSNETSICGTPRGFGGFPTSSNLPSERLPCATSRSPCKHVNLDRRLVIDDSGKRQAVAQRNGGVALDDLRKQPPRVSRPRLSGKRRAARCLSLRHSDTPPWIAAPIATTSSGLISTKACGRRSSRLCARQSATRLAADEDHFVNVGRLQFASFSASDTARSSVDRSLTTSSNCSASASC
jgi:hypothetical protein